MALPNDFVFYRTTAGDTWDQLALDIYGNKFYSAKIMAENPELSNQVILEEGQILRIPIIERVGVESLPPWKR